MAQPNSIVMPNLFSELLSLLDSLDYKIEQKLQQYSSTPTTDHILNFNISTLENPHIINTRNDQSPTIQIDIHLTFTKRQALEVTTTPKKLQIFHTLPLSLDTLLTNPDRARNILYRTLANLGVRPHPYSIVDNIVSSCRHVEFHVALYRVSAEIEILVDELPCYHTNITPQKNANPISKLFSRLIGKISKKLEDYSSTAPITDEIFDFNVFSEDHDIVVRDSTLLKLHVGSFFTLREGIETVPQTYVLKDTFYLPKEMLSTRPELVRNFFYRILATMGVRPNPHEVVDEIMTCCRSLEPRGGALPAVCVAVSVLVDEIPDLGGLEVVSEEDYVGEEVGDVGFVAASEAVIEGLERVRVSEEVEETCSVCLEDVSGGSEAVRLPCKHYFHGDCIIMWLKKSNLCPLCRFEISG